MRRGRRRRRVVTETENGTALKVLRQCPFVHLAFCNRQLTRATSVTKACLLILSRKIICLHCENHSETHKYTSYRFYIFSLLSGHVFYVRSKPTRKNAWQKITEVPKEAVAVCHRGKKKKWTRKITQQLLSFHHTTVTHREILQYSEKQSVIQISI